MSDYWNDEPVTLHASYNSNYSSIRFRVAVQDETGFIVTSGTGSSLRAATREAKKKYRRRQRDRQKVAEFNLKGIEP